ncbi:MULTISPECIES: TIGR02680 family protein [Frankia]|uniref:TIGR02680 family protein n=1 Tax=Frankia TaxID=1854 RepID=UPI0012FEB557|nr:MULTISPECIES: TIGR02680 family protein [Frankia]
MTLAPGPTQAPVAAARWRPSRAGILNVYQYGDETLHFAGGRLLLRGVNGSGKSTAMNMLLPFLLEADTRRIDAAGEQTGVLRSWMLADTEETQRTGYLWIEFARPDDEVPGGVRYHCFGCGIRANRSTDRVTSWWFSTPRRARIDFSLTADRTPLTIDALRAELGAEAVFARAADYQDEVSRRLFGGANPAGYLALLHQIRNPRVGDRIDADLPQRLREALPPVPQDAIADAAQPLEDLEDHRRNVTALEQTDRALGSLLDTYRHYGRRVLLAAATQAVTVVSAARSAAQQRGRLRTAAETAVETERRLGAQVDALVKEQSTTQARLTGLRNSAAYRDHQALLAREQHVADLRTQATRMAAQRTDAQRRVGVAATTVTARRARVDGDLDRIRLGLAEVARRALPAAVPLRLPDPPVLRVEPHAGGVEGPRSGVDPLAELSLRSAADALRRRRQDVREVSDLLRGAERADSAAATANGVAETAGVDADRAREHAAKARDEAATAGERHRAAVLDWAGRFAELLRAVPPAEPAGPAGWLPVPPAPDPGGDELRAVARARVDAAAALAADATEALAAAVAAAGVRVEAATFEATGLAAELAAVRAAAELPLPRGGWRAAEPADAALFASLVDFAPGLDDAARAGLEAACEAVGLLTARVLDDGSVLAATGELLVVPGPAVAPNLAAALVPALPVGAAVGADAVRRVLEHVGLGAAAGTALWVDVDGAFAAGPLRGRHAKTGAEHVGAGARAAARQRRIAELAAALDVAERRRDVQRETHGTLRRHAEALRTHARTVPSTAPVDDAAAAALGATGDARRAAGRAAEAREAAVSAERAAEQTWARAQTGAAAARLPLDDDALTSAAAAVTDAQAELDRMPGRVEAARRSLDDWAAAVAAFVAESDTLTRAAEEAAETGLAAETATEELAAARAALGEEPRRVAEQIIQLEARCGRIDGELAAARRAHTEAFGLSVSARERADSAADAADRAERACRDQRTELLAVATVDGLLAASARERPSGTENHSDAEDHSGPADQDEQAAQDGQVRPPSTPDTIEGTSRLVSWLRERVPEPERDVNEDALHRSLRAIRDGLGAGWDAESRRGADGAPLAVEVSGPYGRRVLPDATIQVAADLRRARGLLTAQQDQALRNLLHGRVAQEVARALFDARELIDRMNAVLTAVTTSQGIGVRLDWRTRGDLDPATATALRLLAKDPDARTAEEDAAVRAAVAGLVDEARAERPEASYRDVIGVVLDYRNWYELRIYLCRPGRADELLGRRTRLSEGEKKLVTYLPMAAAASASAAAHDPHGVGAPRLILLDDAFAKVSEDNHARLFGLLVSLDLDFVVTSERLFGTHADVPELSIIEVLRDPDLRTIALVHYHWDGRARTELAVASR